MYVCTERGVVRSQLETEEREKINLVGLKQSCSWAEVKARQKQGKVDSHLYLLAAVSGSTLAPYPKICRFISTMSLSHRIIYLPASMLWFKRASWAGGIGENLGDWENPHCRLKKKKRHSSKGEICACVEACCACLGEELDPCLPVSSSLDGLMGSRTDQDSGFFVTTCLKSFNDHTHNTQHIILAIAWNNTDYMDQQFFAIHHVWWNSIPVLT